MTDTSQPPPPTCGGAPTGNVPVPSGSARPDDRRRPDVASHPRSSRTHLTASRLPLTIAHADERGDPEPVISVGDPVTSKSRLLSRQCETCIFRLGNNMQLDKGRLRDIVTEATARGSFVVCHDTLPNGPHPDAKPAICRGFFDRYTTAALQLIGRLFGFVEIDPPGTTSP